MTLIDTVIHAEPIANMHWDRIHFLRSIGLDAKVLTLCVEDSPVADRYARGELDGTEAPALYGIQAPDGYRLLTNGPSEDGEHTWALYVRSITRLGARFLEEVSEEEWREVAP